MEFAYQAGVSQQMLHAYITGRSKPPLDSLEHFCGILKLNDADRQQFVWLAQQPYTPSLVWERLTQCEERLREASAQLANAEQEVVRVRTQLAEVVAELTGAQKDTLGLAAKLAEVQSEFLALSAQVAGMGGQDP
jgi:multidrug resistance efflux pump